MHHTPIDLARVALAVLLMLCGHSASAVELEQAVVMLEAAGDFDLAETLAFKLTQEQPEHYYRIDFLHKYPDSEFAEIVYAQTWRDVKDCGNMAKLHTRPETAGGRTATTTRRATATTTTGSGLPSPQLTWPADTGLLTNGRSPAPVIDRYGANRGKPAGVGSRIGRSGEGSGGFLRLRVFKFCVGAPQSTIPETAIQPQISQISADFSIGCCQS